MRADLFRGHRHARARESTAWGVVLLLALSGCGKDAARQETRVPARPFENYRNMACSTAVLADLKPLPGVIPYDLNSALFSDYADKFRFIKLPAGKHATYRDG